MTESPTAVAALSPFDVVVFDLDGVVTDTASVHEAAWRDLFNEVLLDPRVPLTARREPFSPDDYRSYLDGKQRKDGVEAFLDSRGIRLPVGGASDPAGHWSVHGLAERKNHLFRERLGREGVAVFPGTVALLERLRSGQVPVALASSSRNASAVLAAAGLSNAFDLVVDGVLAGELGLAGKPDPALFLEVVHRLGIAPARAVVIEDALAGVEAAHAGGFGLVVGIDRTDVRRSEFEAAGANVVLNDVSELDLGRVLTDPWRLVYEGFDPAHEGHREALTTLGNGYMVVRGAAPESRMSMVRYPGTYLAGVYNRLVSTVQGQVSEDEHLVNVPNCLVLDIRVDGADWWSEGGLKVIRERRVLDLRQASLQRELVLQAEDGRRLELVQRRFVSMARPHLMALETTILAKGWGASLSVRSGMDTGVTNENVPEDALLAHHHLRVLRADSASPVPVIEVETTQSHVRIATALRTRVSGSGGGGTPGESAGLYYRLFDVPLVDGVPLTVTQTAAIVTSRDRAVSSPASGAGSVLGAAVQGFDALLSEHEDAWGRFLRLFVVTIDGSPQV